MERSTGKLSLIFLITSFSVFILDILTKNLSEKYFSIPLEPLPFLELYLIHNKGIAFGLFSNLPEVLRLPILLLVPFIAFFLTFFFAVAERSVFVAICMGLIGGGALGNLYDRLLFGEVRDFIHLHVGRYYWPAFNLADASITVGVALLILKQLLAKSTLKNLFNRTV